MGGKKKSKGPVESVTTYEVVDVPDATPGPGYATGGSYNAGYAAPAYNTGYGGPPGPAYNTGYGGPGYY